VTATTKRKAATTRKPAKAAPVNGNGSANGNGHVAPPEKFEPREQPQHQVAAVVAPEVPAHPYGDRKVQVFTPAEGEPLVVPHISTVTVTEEFLWDNRNLDLMHQSWRWLDLAEVPQDIQRRVVSLDGEDKKRFWVEWFQGFVPPPVGEPPGES
jgi:hypothetical protein